MIMSAYTSIERNRCFVLFGASDDISGPFGLFGRSEDHIGGSKGVARDKVNRIAL